MERNVFSITVTGIVNDEPQRIVDQEIVKMNKYIRAIGFTISDNIRVNAYVTKDIMLMFKEYKVNKDTKMFINNAEVHKIRKFNEKVYCLDIFVDTPNQVFVLKRPMSELNDGDMDIEQFCSM